MSTSQMRWLLLCACLVFGLGFASSIWAVQKLREMKIEVIGQAALMDRLDAIESKTEAIEMAKAKILDVSGAASAPASLEDLMKTHGISDVVSDSREALTGLGDGWFVQTRELSLNDSVLADVDRFSAACSQLRPPWTLMKIDIRSSSIESGRGQVLLTLQQLKLRKRD